MPESVTPARNQFGTFAGVFTPSILTIFGVIMFLRAGYVVGEAGLGHALGILVLGELIVLSTAVSMAAIATNTPVRGGGAYFLISRALGPQFGGAIGLTLYLAQALSVPFYVLGFTQALVRTFPAAQPYFLAIGIGTTIVLFALNYVGADWAIKTQYVVMALLGLAIVSVLAGAALHFDPELLRANWAPGYSSRQITFWTVFAVYFPAVTGILAGINMSGDLRDPARALVRGTLAAIAVGCAVYLAELVLLGGSQTRSDLIARPFETLLENALFGLALPIVAGVFAATLSSAVGSFLGAPRVLQALARDRILPGLGPFARGTRVGDEPRVAMWLTLVLALGVIVAAAREGSLQAFDAVASLVTMLFLATYGMINLAAFVESFGANPSFRPRFRLFHWTGSLLGALACAGAMLLIDPGAATVALGLVAGLYALLSRRVYHSTFGDARRGFVYALIRRHLQQLQSLAAHPKNWRPTILVLSGNPGQRAALVHYGVWLGGGRGLVTVAEIIPGRLDADPDRRAAALTAMQRALHDGRFNAFGEVLITENLDEGIRALVQAHSIGPIKPNTVLFGWPRLPERVDPFMRHLRDVSRLGKSLVCVVEPTAADAAAPAADRIDVWWDHRANVSLMLTLAHLLRQNWEWKRSGLRLLRALDHAAQAEAARADMAALAAAGRIDCDIEAVVAREPFEAVVRHQSRDARLALVGFAPPPDGQTRACFARGTGLAAGLNALLLVASSGEADLTA